LLLLQSLSTPDGSRHRVLLVEANDMPRWVGGTVPHEIHVVPIGLMYVAAAARATGAVEHIRIVESSLDCRTDEAFLALLEDFKPDVVGIRSIVFFVEELQRLARLTRGSSQATIVVGGPIVQAWKDRLLTEVPEVDVAVKGEGERVFSDLLKGSPFVSVTGILYRRGDRVIENPDAPEAADLDALPFPAYDLIDLDRYRAQLSYAYNHRRQAVLVTGRGCVYSCTFCFRTWDSLRLRSAANVFDEITWLYAHHEIRDFYVVDDIFNVSAPRAMEVFDRVIGAGLDIHLYFVNGLRADTVTEAFVDRAIEAGAMWFTYAVESASEDIQQLTRKHVNLERARHIIAYTQKRGVVVNVSTMYGFPGETREQAQHTLDWLGDLPKASLMPYHFCLRFFPGCEIRDQALAAGFSREQLDASAECCYHDIPAGTPTLSRADMMHVAIQYHHRFGLSNAKRVREGVLTLGAVGYSDEEILHLYSVLRRKPVADMNELLAS
jgi:anaerobic magnesium-protoporphyrin IX monomethyl ester cyclase